MLNSEKIAELLSKLDNLDRNNENLIICLKEYQFQICEGKSLTAKELATVFKLADSLIDSLRFYSKSVRDCVVFIKDESAL